jgi:hypothetical protein
MDSLRASREELERRAEDLEMAMGGSYKPHDQEQYIHVLSGSSTEG